MTKPQIGELWIHKQHGYTCLVLGVQQIRYQDIQLVKVLRTDTNMKTDEILGMFTWNYEKLETT